MIEIIKVSKHYGKKQVLNNVSFSVKPSEITALMGLNGSGKSTIMKAIMKLTPFSGEIHLDGQPIRSEDFYRILFVPDEISVVKNSTIFESIEFMSRFYSNFDLKKSDALLEFFRLNPNDRISSLSKGNLAKVNILLSLSVASDYIILDEPFSGIDLLTREEIANVFISDLFQGKGVLISTHEISDIEHLIDHVVIINEGRVCKDYYLEEERLVSGNSIVDSLREVYHGK